MATGDYAIACVILASRCVPVGTVGNLAIGAQNGCFDSRAIVCKVKRPGSVWVCLLPAEETYCRRWESRVGPSRSYSAPWYMDIG